MNKGVFEAHVGPLICRFFLFNKMDMTCGWLNTKCRTRNTQVQNPGQGGLRVKSQGALQLLGVSTSSPRGVQAQLYRFSSAFTICSTNIPLLCQVLLWDPHTALSRHFSPVSSGLWQRLSQPHLCGTLLNLRWTWDIVSRQQGSSLRLLRSRHRSNRKGREGLLMAKDRECGRHKEWTETNVQKSSGYRPPLQEWPVKAVKTPTPFSEDCSRETSHQPALAEWVFNTTKDQGMLFTI